jgi:hypothetical protein
MLFWLRSVHVYWPVMFEFRGFDLRIVSCLKPTLFCWLAGTWKSIPIQTSRSLRLTLNKTYSFQYGVMWRESIIEIKTILVVATTREAELCALAIVLFQVDYYFILIDLTSVDSLHVAHYVHFGHLYNLLATVN